MLEFLTKPQYSLWTAIWWAIMGAFSANQAYALAFGCLVISLLAPLYRGRWLND